MTEHERLRRDPVAVFLDNADAPDGLLSVWTDVEKYEQEIGFPPRPEVSLSAYVPRQARELARILGEPRPVRRYRLVRIERQMMRSGEQRDVPHYVRIDP
jgi:hypothetical protein